MLGLAWRFAAGYIVLPIEISSSRHNLVVALYAMPGGHCRTRKRRFLVRNGRVTRGDYSPPVPTEPDLCLSHPALRDDGVGAEALIPPPVLPPKFIQTLSAFEQ